MRVSNRRNTIQSLELHSSVYLELLQNFREWLYLSGYSLQTVEGLPACVRELFYFLEQEGHRELTGLTPENIEKHYSELKSRPNHRRGGGLSNNYLNKHLWSYTKLWQYLLEVKKLHLPELPFVREEPEENRPRVASKAEIQKMWNLCQERKKSKEWKQATLGSRDEVLLALYYGCGLRRSEAVALEVEDLMLSRRRLRVKTGKGNKGRYVPLSGKVVTALDDWLNHYRNAFYKAHRSRSALLLSERGERVTGQSLMLRLKGLCEAAEIEALTLHGLRHSVATHLLTAGMKLTSVSHFLGHSTLDSTQIYTRVNQNRDGKF